MKLDLFAQKTVEGAPSEWDKPSMALIACDGEGHGCVLETFGPAVPGLNDDTGRGHLDDFGLDDAPKGLSVWIGNLQTWRCGAWGEEWDAELRGEFRSLTPEEWKRLAAGIGVFEAMKEQSNREGRLRWFADTAT